MKIHSTAFEFEQEGYPTTFSSNGGSKKTTFEVIIELLKSGDFNKATFISAYCRNSAFTEAFVNVLKQFREAGGETFFFVGLNEKGTTEEALRKILPSNSAETKNSRLMSYIVRAINDSSGKNLTFHPKLYVFEKSEDGKLEKVTVLLGSSNLTGPGLEINFEANIRLDLDLPDDRILFESVHPLWSWTEFERERVSKYSVPANLEPFITPLTEDILKQLLANNLVVSKFLKLSMRR